MKRSKTLQLDFEWVTTEKISDELLQECSALFSGHYGIWGERGPRPGENIALSPRKLRDYLNGMNGRAALARNDGELICYAFAVIFDYASEGKVAWVTQLVTHREFRERRVATRLLRSIWSFSDYFAWGLVTANPFAVRALETATSRKCDPVEIERYADKLLGIGGELIPYVKDREIEVNLSESVIQTGFFVSHERLPDMIKEAQTHGKWYLGDLNQGKEWFAFTFRDQETRKGGVEELNEQLADSETVLKRAYEGMSLDEDHLWTGKTNYETEFITTELLAKKGDQILDLGCGAGRHTIALGERDIFCVGVDFIQKRVDEAGKSATSKGVASFATFQCADARSYKTGKSFDAAICLYDVVGSFPDENDNRKILSTLYSSLTPGAHALISVMNLSLTESVARNRFVLREDAGPLYALPPNTAMQDTGEIFNPDRFLIDTETKIIYRKEQFDLPGTNLPAEVIVRDRRYTAESISALCRSVGFRVIYTRHVHAGDWVTDLPATDPKAKEVLVLAQRPERVRNDAQ